MINLKIKSQKGQAFSVFKILIAAIVSLAILMLLLNIMGMINFNPSSKPDSAVKDLVKTAYSSPYTSQSKNVTFTEKNNAIVSQQITQAGVGLDESQIIFCEPAASTLSSFSATDGIIYSGKSDKEVTLYAFCSTDGTIPAAYDVFSKCSPQLGAEDTMCFVTIGPKK